jgi:hypothetical protein
MTSELRDRFEDRDVTQDGARGLLGEPSLVIDRKVLYYVPEDPAAGWLFIDCHAEQARRYNVGRGGYAADRDAEPLIRSVRLSGQDFESGLILTLYGKTLRWGPGWWLDHPGQNQRLSPRIGLSRAFSRTWSVSTGLFACRSTVCRAEGTSSSSTRGEAAARSVVTSARTSPTRSARVKKSRAAARSRRDDNRTSMTWPCWSMAR